MATAARTPPQGRAERRGRKKAGLFSRSRSPPVRAEKSTPIFSTGPRMPGLCLFAPLGGLEFHGNAVDANRVRPPRATSLRRPAGGCRRRCPRPLRAVLRSLRSLVGSAPTLGGRAGRPRRLHRAKL